MMGRGEIAARNRLNAQKSTGPKTASEKALVAGNARRHGATARPYPDTVVTWIRVILDDPKMQRRPYFPQTSVASERCSLHILKCNWVPRRERCSILRLCLPWP